jgi:D-serine deaminase-like pyridoxal phosphate-dependent protein
MDETDSAENQEDPGMVEPTHWMDLETPTALVDVDRMTANLRRVGEYCRSWGIAYRPHAKTHKSSELARAQLAAGAVGVTVATPREAEVMAGVCEDILLAYPPVGPSRLRRLLDLPPGIRLSVALDSREALRGLARGARSMDREVAVLVELDMGLGRVGVQNIPDALALAREASESAGIRYGGILIYPGHIRTPTGEQIPAIQSLKARLAALLEAFSEAGLGPSVVSGGSTPTLFHSHLMTGVNEVRPGTWIFNDRTTALLDACAWEECAYSVLATVVSTSVPGQAVVDAGSKALAKEEVRATFPDPSVADGFGCVLDQPELRVTALSEEHGIIDLTGSSWHPRVGDRVRIVPNHVCVSVNLQDRLWQIQGEAVLGFWPVEARGHSRGD